MRERAGAKDAASEFDSRGLWGGRRGKEFEKGGPCSRRSEGGLRILKIEDSVADRWV